MLGQYWYHAFLRKVIVSFGTMFNDIEIHRTEDVGAGPELKRFKVPLSYSSKEKWLRRIREDTTLEEQDVRVQMTLPRVGFEMVSLKYDPTRKINTLTQRKGCNPNDPASVLFQYARVPYDMELQLYVMADKQDDGLQIIEQILPFFAPEFIISIKGVPGLEESVDVPFILHGAVISDAFEGTMDSRRTIIWTLSFTAKMYLFGPVKDSEIIRKSCINIRELVSGALDVKICSEPDPLDAEPGDPFTPVISIKECE